MNIPIFQRNMIICKWLYTNISLRINIVCDFQNLYLDFVQHFPAFFKIVLLWNFSILKLFLSRFNSRSWVLKFNISLMYVMSWSHKLFSSKSNIFSLLFRTFLKIFDLGQQETKDVSYKEKAYLHFVFSTLFVKTSVINRIL